MIQAGLYTSGADPLLDEAVGLWPDLDHFIGSEGEPDQPAFDRLAEILGLAGKPSNPL